MEDIWPYLMLSMMPLGSRSVRGLGSVRARSGTGSLIARGSVSGSASGSASARGCACSADGASLNPSSQPFIPLAVLAHRSVAVGATKTGTGGPTTVTRGVAMTAGVTSAVATSALLYSFLILRLAPCYHSFECSKMTCADQSRPSSFFRDRDRDRDRDRKSGRSDRDYDDRRDRERSRSEHRRSKGEDENGDRERGERGGEREDGELQ